MAREILVDSIDDPRVAGFRNVRDRDLRGRDRLFVVESAMCVRRLLASRFAVESLLLSPRRLAELRDDLASLPADTPLHVAQEEILTAISGYRVHGGALALARRPRPAQLALSALLPLPKRATLVALAGVTHMDNVGSIFRSAAALHADAILLDRRCCDPLLRKPIRVAMGRTLLMPFAWSDDLGADLALLRREHGCRITAVERLEGASSACTVRDLVAAPRLVLLLGNEAHGVDQPLLGACDDVFSIPTRPEAPSLNVAVAAAIALSWRSGGTT